MSNSAQGSRESFKRTGRNDGERVSERKLREARRNPSSDRYTPKQTAPSRTPQPQKPSEKDSLTRKEKDALAEQQALEQLSKKLARQQGLKDKMIQNDSQQPPEPDPAASSGSKFANMRNAYKNKKESFRADWADNGIEQALNHQFKGVGTVLVKGLQALITPVGAKAFLRFMDTFGLQYFGGIIAALVVFIVLLASSTLLLLCTVVMFITLLFAAVMIVLFVPDDKVDVSGIDMSGIDGSRIEATDSSSSSGIASSAKTDGIATPTEIQGKFLAMYADTTPNDGLWHDPRENGKRLHLGVDYDYSGDKGNTYVYPAAEGVVTKVYKWDGNRCGRGGNNNYGHFVDVTHYDIKDAQGRYYVTRYAHLKTVPLVKVGDKVSLNTPIGIIGDTGCSFGPHIHFELIPTSDGKATPSNGVNPDLYLTCSRDGKTVKDFRVHKPAQSRYYHTECFEYSKQMRGLQ